MVAQISETEMWRKERERERKGGVGAEHWGLLLLPLGSTASPTKKEDSTSSEFSLSTAVLEN